MAAFTKIVVVGGGYAGVLAANRLNLRGDVKVMLINPRPHFVERIRLHQLVAGTAEAVVDYAEVLGERVTLTVDTVSRIDADARSVELASGGTVPYDYLVYAVGSGVAEPGVPGAAEFAHPVATFEAARRLRGIVDAAPPSAAVTVVGAGPTGIETAAELAGRGRAVTLVCGGPLGAYLHPRTRRKVARRLRRLGVDVLDGPGAEVTAVTARSVSLDDGSTVPSDVTVWTAGFGVPDLAARSGLTTDEEGRLLTDETLTSVDDDRIVAAGDSASPSGLPFRMSCQAAVQLGPGAADTLLARMAGEEPGEPNVANSALCLSLGRRAGIFQISSLHDVATRFSIGGRAGARIKEYICSHLVGMLAGEGRRPGSLKWKRSDGRRRAEVRARSRAGRTAGRAV